MQKIKTIFYFFILVFSTMVVHGQEGTGKTDFGETMRSNGRIYVVVAVMLTILIGLILYVVRLDKKMTKMEKDSLT